ncbi:MAG: TonB-dependent receptor, partial [Gammaproteobacteria bacterium]
MSFTSPHVVAQSTNKAGVGQLEEIVVRAQKKNRAEDLQEVPAAITAFNELQLDRIIYQDLSDLSYSIPNVQLEEIGTFPGVQNFSIRGQGINSSIPSVDPTVGTFIDGVYVATTYGVVVDNWDLESVEVLRGPQGLLFGRNVSGGAVLMRNIRPDPQGEFEAKARVMTTNEDREVFSVAAGGPLIEDKLAGRIMLYYENDDGYYSNKNALAGAFPSPPFFYKNQQSGNRDLNELETKIARPSLVWTPNDQIEFTLLAEFGNTEGDGAPWTVIDGIDGVIPGQREGVGADGKKLSEFTTTIDEYGDTDIDWKNVTFETNWDIFGGTLTNIFGYREVDVDATSDIDGTGLPLFTATGETDQDQTSNELRFATRLMDRWDLTVGAYYLTQDVSYDEARYIQGLLP